MEQEDKSKVLPGLNVDKIKEVLIEAKIATTSEEVERNTDMAKYLNSLMNPNPQNFLDSMTNIEIHNDINQLARLTPRSKVTAKKDEE